VLSSLPKLADRSFVLGALLPSLLFTVFLLLLFHDQKIAASFLRGLAEKEIGKAAYLLLAVWAIAVLMLMLNLPLYRFLEGYTFPEWMAVRLRKRHQKRLRTAVDEIHSLYELWKMAGNSFPADKLQHYQTLRRDLVKTMPSQEGDVLPTRFGKAIKAFEVYPRDIYGADSIVIWLRLVSVLPPAYLELIQGIRSQIDFLVNCWFFSIVLSLLGLIRFFWSANLHGLGTATGNLTASFQAAWLLWVFGGMIAAYLSYEWAVSRIPAWGELVMSSFDCYLPTLATQLSFELPADEEKRRAFWTTFSQQLIYRREPDGRLPFRHEDWKPVSPAAARVEGPKAAMNDPDALDDAAE
jgi:hypothetical protein